MMNIFLKTLAALTLTTSAAYAKAPANADFVRQLKNPKAYTFNKNLSLNESICGVRDLQHVADYDGSRGQPVEFVAGHEQAVAAMAYTSGTSTRKYCTGTMISEDLFLTASHCIDGTTLNDFAVFNFQKQRSSPDMATEDKYKIVEVSEIALGDLDYAILKIDGKPGIKYGFTKIRPTAIENGNLLTIIQHPSGNPKMVDMGHKLGEVEAYMQYGDLDTEPGSSGSGVIDQEGLLVGVHTNGGCTADGGANSGVLMTEIVKASPIIQELTK